MEKIWIIIPKLSLLPLIIWSTAANSSKEILKSHTGNDITGSKKTIMTEGVFYIVENICL